MRTKKGKEAVSDNMCFLLFAKDFDLIRNKIPIPSYLRHDAQ